ncbi:MAG: hypothetical protein H7A25_07620 [Leptospiraceae bacterium]|nr:hypothetical protein [Leptospiraceae bacterium]
MNSDCLELYLPLTYRVSDDVLQAIQRLNHDLIIDLRKENGIGIRVTEDLSEQKYIELRFPEGFLPAESFEELTSNRDRLHFEQKGGDDFYKNGNNLQQFPLCL